MVTQIRRQKMTDQLHITNSSPLDLQAGVKGRDTVAASRATEVLLDKDIPRIARSLANQLFEQQGSDLHLTPDDGKYRVFLRKNGLLEPLLSVDAKIGRELVNHWKVLAHLDLTLTNRPQDGSILNTQTESVSFRVSTCPTLFGEKIVLRLHSSSTTAFSIKHLGMSENQQKNYIRAIQQSSGLILVAGPTGSGKTNTLYAALNLLQKKPLNIISIEDPIEVNLPGVTQINVNKEFGFPDALRTVLRQDPNVLMIGEIRDRETAEIAISASQTGHLVLASIHATDGYEALQRLQDLGVDLKQVVQQLQVLVSQQLLRVFSSSPQTENAASERYQSRQGVFELLSFSTSTRSKLLQSIKKGDLSQSFRHCIHELNETSSTALLNLIRENKTDWTEIQRVYGWERVAFLSARATNSYEL
jgi:type IV pilus assembly protein PilB